MFFVYILYSKQINIYYIGMSRNPEKRLIYHNTGNSGSKKAFTKRAIDWKVVYKKAYNSKIEALKAEKAIKGMKSRKYIQNIIRNTT